jgi:hypothetical protein
MRCLLTHKMIVLFGVLALSTSWLLQSVAAQTEAEAKASLFINLELGKGPEAIASAGICDDILSFCGGDGSCICGCDNSDVLPLCIPTKGDRSEKCSPDANGFDDCRCVCPSSSSGNVAIDKDIMLILPQPEIEYEVESDTAAGIMGICGDTNMSDCGWDGSCKCGCDDSEVDPLCLPRDGTSATCSPFTGLDDCRCVCPSLLSIIGNADTDNVITVITPQPEINYEDESDKVSGGIVEIMPNGEDELVGVSFGFEVCNASQMCGGIADFQCECECELKEETATCIDNPADDCDPLKGSSDCSGICICEVMDGNEEKGDTNDLDQVDTVLVDGMPDDQFFDIPTFDLCNATQICGSFAGFSCGCGCDMGERATCVDNPEDECDPLKGGSDCSGICICEEGGEKSEDGQCNKEFCGGSLETPCDCDCPLDTLGTQYVSQCVDDPTYFCNSVKGDRNCAGMCVCVEPATKPPLTSSSPTASKSLYPISGSTNPTASPVGLNDESATDTTAPLPATTASPMTVTQATTPPTTAPVTVTETPSALSQTPTAATTSPVSLTQSPVTPTNAPVAVTEIPTATTASPIAVRQVTSAPTEAPVIVTETPTKTPTAATASPVSSTEAPVVPTEAPVVSTDAPVDAKESDSNDGLSLVNSSGWTEITYDDFDSGWGSFQGEPGTADGTGAVMYHSKPHDVSGFDLLRVSFYVKFEGFEQGEGLIVEMQESNDESYVEIDSFVLGMPHDNLYTEFNQFEGASVPLQNDKFYFAIVPIETKKYGNPDQVKFQFRSDVSGDSIEAEVYLDAILFQGK